MTLLLIIISLVIIAFQVFATQLKTSSSVNFISPAPSQKIISKLHSCEFRRSDQVDPQYCNNGLCKVTLPFKSNKLMLYFEEVSKKTSIPADLLAAIARIESTTKDFTISDYTDEDILVMENVEATSSHIDKTIGNTKKAACPRSITGALGLMQLQPPSDIHNAIRAELLQRHKREQKLPLFDIRNDGFNRNAAIRAFDLINAYDEDAISQGIKFAELDPPLTRASFCHPKVNLYLASGLILKKLQRLGYGDGTKWNPEWTSNKQIIDELIASYYGCLKYPNCDTGPYSYSDDVFESMQSCKE